MVEKKIKALKDLDLNTYHGHYSLVKGEVRRVLFKNENTFADYLSTDNFVEAGKNEQEIKPIPVVLPEVDENTIVEVDNTASVEEEKLEVPAVEIIQHYDELNESPIEVLTPEQETEEDLSEVEEIPVEYPDDSKLELSPDEVVDG